jgi:alanine-synthesizing transaminase
MKFSSRTSWLTTPNDLSKLVEFLKSDGKEILDLTVSNPTKCGFSYLTPDLLKAFQDPANLSYDPDPRGLLAAREEICAYYSRRNIRVTPDQIFLTAGTSEAYSFIFRLLFDPGENLLAPKPSYPLLDYLAEINDVKMVRYPLLHQNFWEIELKDYYTELDEDPRALLLVNPNNPTGNYVHQAEFAEVNLFCKKRNMALIVDEVFWDYPVKKDPAREITSFAGNRIVPTFTLSGISKILGLPQMKLSWIVLSGNDEKDCRETMERLQIISDAFLSVSTPAQRALKTWFAMEKEIQTEINRRTGNNFRFLEKTLSSSAAQLFSTEGGWYAVLKMPADKTDEEWARLLLKNKQVLAHPGYLFDFDQGNFLALSLLAEEAVFQEGVKRIKSSL